MINAALLLFIVATTSGDKLALAITGYALAYGIIALFKHMFGD